MLLLSVSCASAAVITLIPPTPPSSYSFTQTKRTVLAGSSSNRVHHILHHIGRISKVEFGIDQSSETEQTWIKWLLPVCAQRGPRLVSNVASMFGSALVCASASCHQCDAPTCSMALSGQSCSLHVDSEHDALSDWWAGLPRTGPTNDAVTPLGVCVSGEVAVLVSVFVFMCGLTYSCLCL